MSAFELAPADDVDETLLEESDAVEVEERQPWRRALFGTLGITAVVGLALGLVATVKPIGIKMGPYLLSTKGYNFVDTAGISQKDSTQNTHCENGVCCSKSTMSGSVSCATCFPGQAEVQMQDKRFVKINRLQVGDRVLVESSSGKLVYEPVLSFIHSGGVGTQSEFLTIQHATGALRVSANHVLFVSSAIGRVDKVAEQIVEGDELFVVPAGTSELAAPSKVLSVTRERSDLGMYAPLTPSGKIVVDGTVASNYATISGMHFGHEASHAAFFPLRAYHKLGLSPLLAPFWGPSTGPEIDEVHPLAVFFTKSLLQVIS
jgi:hypothetical protein